MREVVLANDDFGIHAELARPTENFKDASRRGGTSARIAKQLDVDHCAVQFRHSWNALRTRAVLFRELMLPFSSQRWRQLFAGRNFDFVLDADVVRQDDVSSRAIVEQADHGKRRAAENSNDAAFGPLRPGKTGHASELHKDMVAVHGVFDGIARNEDVAIQLRHGLIRNNEAVAVMVEDEAAFDFISTGDVRRMLCGFGIAAIGGIRLLVPAAWKTVTSPGQLFNRAMLF